MWIVTTVPALAAALVAAALAWHQATRLDQRAASAWLDKPQDKQSRVVLLGALVAAVAAALSLQLIWLSRLGSAG
jgi:hypothetical protein